jgi:tetratricopeptide (TPR) repeat protein
LQGRYDLALQQYEKTGDLEPGNISLNYYIGHCFRMLKEYKKAEKNLLGLLRMHPYWPEELYETGLIYDEWGKTEKALEYVQRSVDVWANADPGHKMASEARLKLAELQSVVK